MYIFKYEYFKILIIFKNESFKKTKIQILQNSKVDQILDQSKFQTGTNFKPKQISNWNKFQTIANFKSKQI
jgi:hypothetical protein